MAISFDNLPNDSDLASKVVEVKSAHEATCMEQGWLGRAFGDVKNKSGNIAGFVIALSFLMLFTLCFVPDSPHADKLATGCIALITLALGYIFGKAERSESTSSAPSPVSRRRA